MRYNVQGLTIKSENAAQGPRRASRRVLEWIWAQETHSRILDYGCGKLRYTLPLSRRVREVLAVDSEAQLSRVQTVNGCRTSLIEYSRCHLENVRLSTPESVAWQCERLDAALLANVLSAVPVLAERERILARIRSCLRPGGELFLCSQFRNSTCDAYPENPRAERYLDGWFVRHSDGKGASFYAMLSPTDLAKICHQAQMEVVREETIEHSAYLTARRADT